MILPNASKHYDNFVESLNEIYTLLSVCTSHSKQKHLGCKNSKGGQKSYYSSGQPRHLAKDCYLTKLASCTSMKGENVAKAEKKKKEEKPLMLDVVGILLGMPCSVGLGTLPATLG